MAAQRFWMTLAAAAAVACAACGGNGGSTPTGPSGNGGNSGNIAATITIGADGVVSPKEVTVAAGSRVTFTNNHDRNHEMASDPHPTHGSCPGIDQVGLIAPGQSRTSGNLNTARTCTYHDHINDTNVNLQGTIRVQ